MSKLKTTIKDDGFIFTAKIVPGGSRTCISGLYDEMLKIKLSAPPEKGKANMSLIDFLAKKLGIKKNDIEIISGQTNTVKQIHILGLSADEFTEKLGLEH